MKIGVYVGSFNPPHKGHIKIVNHLLDKNYLDKIIIIPTGNYWDKNNLVNINDRINMLKFYKNENIIIDNKNNNIEYTYQLLKNLSKEHKKDNLYLIIGADNIINFDKWKNYQEVLNLFYDFSKLSNEYLIVGEENFDEEEVEDTSKQKGILILGGALIVLAFWFSFMCQEEFKYSIAGIATSILAVGLIGYVVLKSILGEIQNRDT